MFLIAGSVGHVKVKDADRCLLARTASLAELQPLHEGSKIAISIFLGPHRPGKTL